MASRIAIVGLVLAVLPSIPVQAADGLSCAAFMQNRDGTWRSFNEADVIGPEGPVHIEVGERLSPFAKSAKGDIARALNDLCAAR